jgi:hypothetical protein
MKTPKSISLSSDLDLAGTRQLCDAVADDRVHGSSHSAEGWFVNAGDRRLHFCQMFRASSRLVGSLATDQMLDSAICTARMVLISRCEAAFST